MSKLDENQEKVVNHFLGPALVLAGPGSGKTTVLTERALRLGLKTNRPDKILCVTFTNSAASEMEKRYENKIKSCTDEKNNNLKPVFKTVHSLCNYILSEYEGFTGKRFKRLTSEEEISAVIKRIYCEINNKEIKDSIMKYIMQYKNQKRKTSDIKNIQMLFGRYESYKTENGLIDFDDMVTYAYRILNSKKEIDVQFNKIVREKFDFIQIDEAQDLTREQFCVLEKICKTDNVFVVADDDQSIYGFRGAEPENLFLFKDKHTDCKVYYLSRNYRSSQNIVSLSKSIISNNKKRFEKDLYTLNESEIVPLILCFKNCLKQGEFIIKEICRLRNYNYNLSVGILFRNNYSGIIPGMLLAEKNINYKKESGNIFTYDIPCIEKLIKRVREEERNHVFVPTPEQTFRKMIENGFEKEIESICKDFGREMMYKEYLMLYFYYLCKMSGNAKEMIKIMERMDFDGGDSNICLSTVHSSKGLEFDAVFVIDMVMGVFPGKDAVEVNNIEEERRLFYVAVTRAKKYLYITYPAGSKNKYIAGKMFEKSFFLDEI